MTKYLLPIVVAVALIVAAYSAGKATAAETHWRTIPYYVMLETQAAAAKSGTGARCHWMDYYHHHIRCTLWNNGVPGVVTVHRVGTHSYLWVGTIYGIEIMRKVIRF